MFEEHYYQGHKVQITKMFTYDGDMLVNFKVWGTGEIKQGVKIEELKDTKEQSLGMKPNNNTEVLPDYKPLVEVSDNAVVVEGNNVKVEGKTTPKTIEYVFTRIKDGKEFPVNAKGLDKFVKDHSLSMEAIQLILDGKQKTHKGFSVKLK